MNNEPMPLLAALDKITTALAENGPDPAQPLPTNLDRDRIATAVSVFQTKDIDGRYAEDGAHVRNLKGIIGKSDTPQYLDPVTVWWGGDRWYLLDGHRRLAAYRLAKVRKGIPVTVFVGSLDDARARSVALNSKDQMPMSTADKMNCAWKLVITTKLSRTKLMRACSVSKGSIDNIRAVRNKLAEERELALEELAQLTWESARREAEEHRTDIVFDPDEATRKNAERILKRLVSAGGPLIVGDTEATALALQMLDFRLPGLLMQSSAWSAPLRRTIDDLRFEIGEDNAELILERLPCGDADADDDY